MQGAAHYQAQHHRDTQLSNCSPVTLANSRVLWVTRVDDHYLSADKPVLFGQPNGLAAARLKKACGVHQALLRNW
jgi:hypothetical protein